MDNLGLGKYIGKAIAYMHIMGTGHIAMTKQSSDCDAVTIKIDEDIICFKHIPSGENGDIEIGLLQKNDVRWYNVEVDLSRKVYRLKKVVYEDGNVDMIVFQSENDHLHICSSDHNLIVNKSIADLSESTYLYDDPSVLLI